MKLMSVACCGVLAGLLSGCLVAPFEPPTALVSSYTAPLSTEGTWTAGDKCGKASAISVLGLYASGDCSISAAIKEGGLQKAYFADYAYLNIFGIYQRTTVIVTGE